MDLVASSLYGAWIVSPKALAAEAADSKYFETGIDAGTGPYTIESYTPDKRGLWPLSTTATGAAGPTRTITTRS